jgi:aminoglycoside/choline kinase family phosphotransferase
MDDSRNSSSLGEDFKEFVRFFLKARGEDPGDFMLDAIPSDGSRRGFWRIAPRSSDRTFVAMMNEPVDDSARRENRAYLMIGRHLYERGLPLPRIYRSNLDKGWFIMEDFGAVSLQQKAASVDDRIPLYENVVEVLLDLQIKGSREFSPSWTCQTKKYDALVMRRYEADYFRDAFLCNYLGLRKEWEELESPFTHLAGKALLAEGHFFLHRDFQSRNIMVMEDRIGVLDWQGGRLGPLGYDLASLLIDPYANLSEEEKTKVYRGYVERLSKSLPESVRSFTASFPYLAVQRNLQILGAFSFLSRVLKKAYFEAYIAPAMKSLRDLLVQLEDEGLSRLRDLVLSLEDPKPPIAQPSGRPPDPSPGSPR